MIETPHTSWWKRAWKRWLRLAAIIGDFQTRVIDAAAALLCDGDLIAAAEEERFSRKKHDFGFPTTRVEEFQKTRVLLVLLLVTVIVLSPIGLELIRWILAALLPG